MPIVKLLLILFIAAQVVFFATLLRPALDALLFPAGIPLPELTGGHSPNWPPKVGRAETFFDTRGLPLVNTLILLTSGITVTWAQHALMQGNRRGLKWGLFITIVLGILFVLCQVYEYLHAGFNHAGSIYAAIVFMATGYHGGLMIAGTLLLIVCLVAALVTRPAPTLHFGFEAAAWYWHFVDVVWLWIFLIAVWAPSTPGRQRRTEDHPLPFPLVERPGRPGGPPPATRPKSWGALP